MWSTLTALSTFLLSWNRLDFLHCKKQQEMNNICRLLAYSTEIDLREISIFMSFAKALRRALFVLRVFPELWRGLFVEFVLVKKKRCVDRVSYL